jgi:CheY-like chemotaxis protein
MKKINLVCVVEDDLLHQMITKKLLERTGLVDRIIIFKNGKDAYDTLKSLVLNKDQLPKLIFLDLNMPIWDGWTFLEEFTKIPVDELITIYILTSSDNDADIRRAEKFNLVNKYLIKPIDISQIKSILLQLAEG